jgi:hypothetical protein
MVIRSTVDGHNSTVRSVKTLVILKAPLIFLFFLYK